MNSIVVIQNRSNVVLRDLLMCAHTVTGSVRIF